MVEKNRVFGKVNYTFLLAGVLILLAGFILMGIGTLSASGDIYSFRKITLSPILIVAGYGILILSIFKN